MSIRDKIIDGVTVAGAFSSPLWLEALKTYVGAFMLVGGAVLLAIRIAVAWKEFKKKD